MQHPDPLTMGRYIKGLKNMTVKGSYINKDFSDLNIYLGKLGFASRKPVQVGSVSVSPIDFMSRFSATEEFRQTAIIQRILESQRKIGEWIGLRVEVKGRKAGKPAWYIYSHFKTYGVTATPDGELGW